MAERMPALFIGHGSPMNAIENNRYTEAWVRTAAKMPRPAAILSVSAHWFTRGTRTTDARNPRVVYDMYGFPDTLYRVVYQPDGMPELANETLRLIGGEVKIDNTWGIDHGTWAVLCRMYPKADIPVVQLSVDANADAETHYGIGVKLRALRERGVMILGSGNVVHNLSRVDWNMEGGYPWAEEFDAYIAERVVAGRYGDAIDYGKAGSSAELAFQTPDHFNPLLYVLGAARGDDRLTVFNRSCAMGSLSMTCYLFE